MLEDSGYTCVDNLPVRFLHDFGVVGWNRVGQRVGRNPKTGEEVPITPRRVLVFRPSQVMKTRININGGGEAQA